MSAIAFNKIAMKKLLILPIIAFLMACDTDDDGFYNVAYVRAADALITVEPQDVYLPGDVLYVSFFVPDQLSEAGNPLPIDVNQSTGNAPSYEVSYYLERQVGSEWEVVDLTGDFVADIGTGQSGFFVLAKTADAGTSYNFRGGLTLPEAGNYRLRFNTNNDDGSLATIRSDSKSNNLILNIYSTVENTENGVFNFTIN